MLHIEARHCNFRIFALAAVLLSCPAMAQSKPAQSAPSVDAMIAATLNGARAGHVGCIRTQLGIAVKKRVGERDPSTYEMPGLEERIALADEVIAGCAQKRAAFLANLNAIADKQLPFGAPTRAVVEQVRTELDAVETELRNNLRNADTKTQDSNAPNN